jgi:hypothetical protein
MMEVYHQVVGAEVQVFHSMDEALQWLGKPLAEAELGRAGS